MKNIGTLERTLVKSKTPLVTARRIRKRAVLVGRAIRHDMSGGPLSAAWLCSPGTLAFRVGEWRGYYNGKNEWVKL